MKFKPYVIHFYLTDATLRIYSILKLISPLSVVYNLFKIYILEVHVEPKLMWEFSRANLPSCCRWTSSRVTHFSALSDVVQHY